jgi:hypothetical protein
MAAWDQGVSAGETKRPQRHSTVVHKSNHASQQAVPLHDAGSRAHHCLDTPSLETSDASCPHWTAHQTYMCANVLIGANTTVYRVEVWRAH